MPKMSETSNIVKKARRTKRAENAKKPIKIGMPKNLKQ